MDEATSSTGVTPVNTSINNSDGMTTGSEGGDGSVDAEVLMASLGVGGVALPAAVGGTNITIKSVGLDCELLPMPGTENTRANRGSWMVQPQYPAPPVDGLGGMITDFLWIEVSRKASAILVVFLSFVPVLMWAIDIHTDSGILQLTGWTGFEFGVYSLIGATYMALFGVLGALLPYACTLMKSRICDDFTPCPIEVLARRRIARFPKGSVRRAREGQRWIHAVGEVMKTKQVGGIICGPMYDHNGRPLTFDEWWIGCPRAVPHKDFLAIRSKIRTKCAAG